MILTKKIFYKFVEVKIIVIFVSEIIKNKRMENDNKPAHPITEDAKNRIDHGETFNGLTKREYFAGLAMQGLLSSRDWNHEPYNEITALVTSHYAIELADELLEQLEKQ